MTQTITDAQEDGCIKGSLTFQPTVFQRDQTTETTTPNLVSDVKWIMKKMLQTHT